VNLSTHVQLVLRSRKRESTSIHPLPNKCSWRSSQIGKHCNNLLLADCLDNVLNISQPYRRPRPVTEIAFFSFFFLEQFFFIFIDTYNTRILEYVYVTMVY
jgi:hypothetical protein